MLSEFLKYSHSHDLFRQGERVLLAVSGGLDSVVMAWLFQKAGVECGIAHCNFSLRGSESEEDAAFVSDLASSLGMPLHLISFDTEAYAAEHGLSIQVAARELRYAYFRRITDQANYNRVALAHHADDQVETILINLGRGSGIRGLRGMPTKHDPFIRPLLFATRSELHSFAMDQGIEWREDSSNAQLHYQRNRIRHEVLPVLAEIIPGFAGNALESASYLAEYHELAEYFLRDLRKEIAESSNIRLSMLPDDPVLAAAMCKELLKPYGFSSNEALTAFSQSQGSRVIGQSFIAEKGDGMIFILPLPVDIAIPEPAWISKGFEGECIEFGLRFSIIDWHLGMKPDPDPNLAFLDMDTLEFPLLVRYWEPGDRMKPLGLKGTKLLSDLFNECKVPSYARPSIPILLSKGEICWVAGLRLGNSFRVKDGTRRVYKVELMK